MCLARLNADGTLDPTFIGPNGTGNGTFNVSLPSNVDLEVISAALQPDGKILVGGNCGDNPPRFVLPTYRFCVSRFNTNGTWDLPFSNGTGSGQTGMMLLPLAPGNSYNRGGTIALQSDGKIVIAGGCSNPSGTSDPPNYTQSCVARLNANGSVDTTFGAPSGAGWVLLPRLADPLGYGVYSPLSAIALQPDGKIIVAGICEDYGNAHKHCLARLNGANGALDASFVGPAGTGSGIFLLPINSNVPQLKGRVSIALQPNGKIVLAGYCSATGIGPDDQGLNHFDFCLARMLGNGAFDTSFVGPAGDAAGRFVMPVGDSEDFAFSMALQPNGRIVVAGGCIDTFNDAGFGPNPGTFDFCVVRFNSDGSIDQDFAGPRPTAGNSRYLLPVGVYDDFVNSVALQPDGKIVLAGACRDATSYFDFDFCVARLNGDAVTGSACMPDVDGDGSFLPMTDSLMLIRYALGLASDAVIAGINFPAGATRKTSSRIGGFLASLCEPEVSCQMDIDGNGAFNANTDALILARLAMGFRGPALISGMTFGAGATRNTWVPIRDYLSTQCGLSPE